MNVGMRGEKREIESYAEEIVEDERSLYAEERGLAFLLIRSRSRRRNQFARRDILFWYIGMKCWLILTS